MRSRLVSWAWSAKHTLCHWAMVRSRTRIASTETRIPRSRYHPTSGRLGGDHRLPHHVEHDLVGHEFTAIEILLNGQAQSGPPRHVIAQEFTGRDVVDVEVRGDQCALSPLARARGRDHQYPHTHLLPPSSRPP